MSKVKNCKIPSDVENAIINVNISSQYILTSTKKFSNTILTEIFSIFR